MSFDFPSNPPAGTIHTEAGVEYVWSGEVWNLASGGDQTDYVLKAGDVMTGPLTIADNAGLYVRSAPAGSVSQGLMLTRDTDNEMIGAIRMTWVDNLGGEAAMEFWTKNGGYGHLMAFRTIAGSPPGMEFKGPVAALGRINSSNGISFGAVVDANADDFAKHIELYSGTNGMGIGTITGGQFNFVLKNLGHAFNFRIAAATKVQINQYGIMMQDNAGLIDFGSLNTNASPSANNKGIRFFYSGSAAYHIGVSTNQLNYVISVGSTRHSFWQGGAERSWIDSTGLHGVAVTAGDGFKDRSPARLANLRAEHPELSNLIEDTAGDSEEGAVEGIDLGKLLLATLAKVKVLEREVASLRRGRR
jgi:hypothetical protein